MPVAVATHSPCSACSTPAPSRQWAITGLSGVPAWRLAKCSLQPMSKPQLDDCSGATSTPRSASHGCHAPSEPSCGQLPPPSASTTASARTSTAPLGDSKRNAPSALQPVQRCCTWKRTPASRSRRTQPRSSGAALRSAGNTRPDVPI